MTGKGQVLIIDSTGNRCEELGKLWSGVLSYEVIAYGGGDFLRFHNGDGPEKTAADKLSDFQPLGCLFHNGDLLRHKEPEIQKLVNSSRRVVMFSGVGLAGTKSGWSADWFWIPRAINGKESASDSAWRQLGEWFQTPLGGPTDGRGIELLSVRKRPQFLIAIYILCQGFLAAERIREKRPAAVEQTRTREWWNVPLLKAASDDLTKIVTQEWRGNVPNSVLQLVKWISEEPAGENLNLADIVDKAKKELECRITK